MRCMMLTTFLVTVAGSAFPDISVRFVQGERTDTFIIENVGSCPVESAVIMLDLSGSRGDLIFDVMGSDGGVDDTHPIDVIAGAENILEFPEVTDGDTGLRLSVSRLEEGARIAFHINVDDAVEGGAKVMADADIAGAAVVVKAHNERISAFFKPDSQAMLTLSPCPRDPGA